MIQSRSNYRGNCVVYKPRNLGQISYCLGQDLYIYSLENENSNCFFKHNETSVKKIRKDLFFRVLDDISKNIEELLFQLR